MCRTPMLFAAACAAVPSFAGEAPSNHSTPFVELAPVVVEASRLGRTTMEMPQEVQVITSGEIARSGAKDVPDLLDKCAGGVFVRRLSDNPAMSQISMRGYGANSFGRVLVLVDGECLNNPDMDAPNLGRIPLASVSRVEVLHGPQTVLQGDSSSAGVVNVITRNDGDYEQKTSIGVHGGSWGTIGIDAATRGGDADSRVTYNAGGAYEHSDGYRDHSGWDFWNANGAVRREWENGSYLGVSTFWSKNRYDTAGALSRAQLRRNPKWSGTKGDWYDRVSYGLNLAGGLVVDDANKFEMNLSASVKDWEARSYGSLNGAENFTLRFTPRYTCTARLGSFDNKFQLGFDFGCACIDDAHQGNARSVDYLRLSYALYAHDEFFLTDELSLFAGVRGERFDSRVDTRGSSRETPACEKVAGEAGVNWRPLEDMKLYAKWSRFYRAPFADEMFVYNSMYVPNYDLDPEWGDSIDFGAAYEWCKEFTASADFYYSRTRDEILYGGFGGLGYMNLNLPWDTERAGADFALAWKREKTAYAALRYSLVDARLEGGPYDNHRVPMVPRQQLSLTGGVNLWDECVLFGGFHYMGEQPSEADFDKSYAWVKSYCLFDVGVRYEPQWLQGLSVVFAIDNLFDRVYANYATYGYYYPGAGRCFRLSLRWEF